MCGICGVYHFGEGRAERELVGRMNSVLQHRGPDGTGSYVSGRVGLGHTRLSIIDLDGGAQPLTNEDGSLQVVFNGEIYNYIELTKELASKGHIFTTRSDTEVILHGYEEWGHDCVDRFNGMFAFALWDSRRQELFLARDHLGVKPLYYVELRDRVLFGSEIKALLQDSDCPREVDLTALGVLFTLRYVPSPDTLFQNIKKLPPGHRMVVSRGGIDIQEYWTQRPQTNNETGEEALKETYQYLLTDAVRLQMRSDVPVGLFLSSGIDSGALLALMSLQTGNPVRTFTIGFEHGEKSNETDDARAMAARFGADHREMVVTAKDYEKYYERYLWDLEEPVGNETAAAFYFVSLIASREVKVALTGQGADEPWAGYGRHLGIRLSQMYSRLPTSLTRGLAAAIAPWARREQLKRGLVSLSERDLLTRFVKVYSFFSSGMKERLFQPWLKQEIASDESGGRTALRRLQTEVGGLDPLTQMLYIDTRANLPDDLLMVGDKTSMANSLEARVPYLDRRLIEFVESLPPGLRLRGFHGKYLHKKAIEKWLPKSVVYRKKKGFANPIDEWLRSGMRSFIGDCLLSENAAVNRYFDRRYIAELVAKHQSGQEHYLRHIYLLLSFELWHQQFMRAPSASLAPQYVQ
jgi:asparagine synthase (glutamine-hydrolysing)